MRQGQELFATSQIPVDETALPRGSETILLVEDEQMVREVAARGLRGQGYSVIEAIDGLEALALVQEHGNRGVDLLFTDIVMPMMSGWVLASRMEAAMPGIKVLFTSGYSEEVIGRCRIDDRASIFLRKPFTPGELARRVRAVLES